MERSQISFEKTKKKRDRSFDQRRHNDLKHDLLRHTQFKNEVGDQLDAELYAFNHQTKRFFEEASKHFEQYKAYRQKGSDFEEVANSHYLLFTNYQDKGKELTLKAFAKMRAVERLTRFDQTEFEQILQQKEREGLKKKKKEEMQYGPSYE